MQTQPQQKTNASVMSLIYIGKVGKSIYERVIEARKIAGLDSTQASIAKDLGIAQSAVSAWRRGSIPKLKHALEIAYAAGVSLEWLYTGRQPKMAVKAGSDLDELLNLLDQMSPEDQDEILRFARFRADSKPE